MKNSTTTITTSLLLAGAAIGGVCAADDCQPVNPEAVIADLVIENEGGKVLKVEETIDAQGCVELKVRILIDGTIKAITIPNETGA